uniref:Cytochrome P450 n=1 Tax=Globodera pallida TaxID=36090 RepID=A0A183BVZ9_GLOPA
MNFEPVNTELFAELKKIRDEKMALELTVKEHKEKLVFFDLKLKQEKAKGDQHALQLQTKKQHIKHLESQLFDQSILKEKNDTYKRRIVASDFYAHLMKNGGDDEAIDKYIKLNGQPDETKFLKLMRNQRDEEIKKNKKLGSEIKKERLERCKREKEVGELRKENEELRKENERSKKRRVDGAGGTSNLAQYQPRPSFGFSFTDPNDKGEVVHAAKNFAFEGDSSVEILSGSDKPSTYSNTKILDQFDPIHLNFLPMASLILLLLPLLVFSILIIRRHFKLRHQFSLIPSPRSFPFLGHMLITKPDIQETVAQIMAMAYLYPSYPRMTAFWIGPAPTVMVYSATLLESITMARQRVVDKLCRTMETKTNYTKLRKQTTDLLPTFHHWAMLRIIDIIQRRQHNPLMWLDTIFNWFGDGKEHSWALKVLHSFTRNVIVERREMRAREGVGTNGNGDERLAFLDLLLEMEQHGELKEQDIQNEVDTFMFEGHDTTSSAVVWALFMLGNHQSIQQRVFDEIQSVCGCDPSEEVSIEQLGKLSYLECCTKEILRLYPSVPFVARCLSTDTTIGGNRIPANTQVLLNIYLVHRDPEHWQNPEVFDPDRSSSVRLYAFLRR